MIVRFFLLAAVLLVAGCGGRFETSFDRPVGLAVTKDWTVDEVIVFVPETLSVTESNAYAPNADIVWHGDPEGDRRSQVAAILREGIFKGSRGVNGRRRVTLSATLIHFHAVTPRAVSRAPAAVHNISFSLQAFDTVSGDPITEKTTIEADFEANVGAAAIVAAQQGQTQKVRIVDHIGRVTAGWLGSGPDPRRSFVSIGR